MPIEERFRALARRLLSCTGMKSFLHHLYDKYLPMTRGRTTDILPQLQEADANTFFFPCASLPSFKHHPAHDQRKRDVKNRAQ